VKTAQMLTVLNENVLLWKKI